MALRRKTSIAARKHPRRQTHGEVRQQHEPTFFPGGEETTLQSSCSRCGLIYGATQGTQRIPTVFGVCDECGGALFTRRGDDLIRVKDLAASQLETSPEWYHCPNCTRCYIGFEPKVAGICDLCGGHLVARTGSLEDLEAERIQQAIPQLHLQNLPGTFGFQLKISPSSHPLAPLPVLPDNRQPTPPIYEPQMVQDENLTVKPDGTLVKDRVPYRPLSFAASQAKTHRTTLLHWIKNKTKVGGQPLRSYYFAPLDTYFISEESIQRAANRFIKWPFNEPAGPVTLGETDDRSGYIGLPNARKILGISNRTMYLWATQGKAPTDKPLDVIKDPISEHFYIREKDVYDLKKLIPKRGLHRGRRPQLALLS